MFKVLADLIKTIKKRKKNFSKNSYTYFLFKKGRSYVLGKFREEFLELVSAIKYKKRKQIIYESADLIYHFFVLLDLNKIKIQDILKELKRRQDFSGIEEKRSRKNNVRQ